MQIPNFLQRYATLIRAKVSPAEERACWLDRSLICLERYYLTVQKAYFSIELGIVTLEVGLLIIAQSEANYFCSKGKRRPEKRALLCQKSEVLLYTERLNEKAKLLFFSKVLKIT